MANKVKLLPRLAGQPAHSTQSNRSGQSTHPGRSAEVLVQRATSGLSALHGLHSLPQLIDSRPDGAAEIRAGLLAAAASIAPKYLYDGLGSKLFEAITELPEYYPTRTERAILARCGAEVAALTGRGGALIDLGAGNCAKAAALFGVLRPAQYVAIDIAEETLGQALNGLRNLYPGIAMLGLAQDFSERLALPAEVRGGQRVFFYPGSSIGNFSADDALRLLTQIRAECGSDGNLLIGVDLVKDAALLEAAYDDALGVTRAFNLNLLNHVNALIGADFQLGDWEHRAHFDRAHSRVEMALLARRDLTVSWPGAARAFVAGERIHTENSYKYELAGFCALLRRAGFERVASWTDERRWFGVCLASA